MSTEESSGGVLRWGLRFGVGVGVLCALWMLGLQLTGNNPFGPKRLMAQFLVPLAVIASQWFLRRDLRPANPGLLRAVGVGALTTVLAALIAASSLYALGQSAGPTALARNRAELLEIARTKRKYLIQQSGGEAAYKQQVAQLDQLTFKDIAESDFTKIMILGLVFALPAGVFLRE